MPVAFISRKKLRISSSSAFGAFRCVFDDLFCFRSFGFCSSFLQLQLLHIWACSVCSMCWRESRWITGHFNECMCVCFDSRTCYNLTHFNLRPPDVKNEFWNDSTDELIHCDELRPENEKFSRTIPSTAKASCRRCCAMPYISGCFSVRLFSLTPPRVLQSIRTRQNRCVTSIDVGGSRTQCVHFDLLSEIKRCVREPRH